MKRRLALVGLLGWVVLLSACGGEDSSGAERGESSESEDQSPGYILAKANGMPPVGTQVTVSETLDFEDAVLVIKAGGQTRVGSSTTEARKILRYEVVSDREVKALVEEDVETQERLLNRVPVSDPPRESPIKGLPLTFRLEEDGWAGVLDGGGELNEEQLEKVNNLATRFAAAEPIGIYGELPRKVGETWDVDPKMVPGMKDSDLKGSFELTFSRLSEFEGTRCAVLTGEIKVTGKQGDQADGLDLQMTARLTIHRSLEFMEDMKMVIEGSLAFSGVGENGAHITLSGPFRMEQEARMVLPKEHDGGN